MHNPVNIMPFPHAGFVLAGASDNVPMMWIAIGVLIGLGQSVASWWAWGPAAALAVLARFCL